MPRDFDVIDVTISSLSALSMMAEIWAERAIWSKMYALMSESEASTRIWLQ
jgi:hypothetical protein